jgi:hypothetical protein
MPLVDIPGVGKVNFPDDMSQEDILNAIQKDILPSIKTAPAPTDKPADFSAKETALALGQGIVGAGKSITDVFGAENVASQALGRVQTTLGEQFSPERKAEMARREAIQKKASESGSLVEEIGAFLAGVAEAPVQSLAQGLGSIVPYVGTGIIGAIAKLGGPTVMAINTALGAAQGAGAVKGSIYDNVRDELVRSGMKLEEAEVKAAKAQEYLGGNLLDIAGGAALGGVGARYGVEKLLTPGAAGKLDARLLSRMGKAALAEAPLEGTQAFQEQTAVNRALQQAGFDVDTFKGAAGAAARDAAIGALTGSAVGAVRGPGIAPAPSAPPPEEGEATAPPPAAPPVTPAGGVPPEALDLETLLGAAPAAEDIADVEIPAKQVKASGKTVEQLEESIAERQAKLDAGTHKNPKAAVNTQAKEIAELEALKAKGEQDAIQQTDRGTSGDGTELLGGPPAVDPAAGVAGTGRPGVASDQGTELAPQDGARSEQPTLEPATSVNTTQLVRYGDGNKGALLALDNGKTVEVIQYSPNEFIGPGGEDLGTTLEEAAATILARETTNPVLAMDENRRVELVKALEEKTTQRKEREERRKNKVIDLADERKAKIEEEENRLDDEDEILLDQEQAALNKEAAAELAGEVTPSAVTPAKVTKTKPAPVIKVDQDASTPEAQTKRDEVVTKVNTFEGIRKLLESRKKDEKTGKDKPGTGIESFDKKVKVAGPKGKVVKEVKIAKPIKWRGKKGTQTENPSPYNFLNKNSYYSDKSPEQIAKQSEILAAENKKVVAKSAIEAGVESAAFDEAYDLYDSIAYEERVLPEIKAVMAQRQAAKDAEIDAANQQNNANREAKRAQLIDEGRSPKVIKEALSVIKDLPKVKYQETKPLEFMSEQEVLDLFKKNVGTKTDLEEDEGGQARVDLAKDRTAFVNVLSPADKIKFGMMAESILDMEIISAVQDNKVTTAGDRRTEKYRKKQEAKVISEVEQQLKDAEITAKQIEQKAARIAKRAEEKKQEKAQVTKEVETEEAEAKSKLVVGIEKSIVEGSLDTVLEVIADKKKQVNESTTRNIAQSFIDLVSDFGNITIQFGSVPKGKDGQFDPKTDTITIKGENGVYTGERALDETVLHEVGHYLTDHIFDSEKNKKAYIESIPTASGKRKAVQNAINRLDNNYRLVKNKLGDKFNIPTIKEFIAEIYSNPRFQEAVAALDTGKLGIDYTKFVETKPETATEEAEGYVTGTNREIPGPVKQYVPAKESLYQRIVKNIANVLGFNISEKEGFVNDPARAVILKQSIEDIARIISLPTADIRSKKVSYATAAQPKAPKKEAPSVVEKKLREDEAAIPPENSAYNPRNVEAKDIKYFKRLLFTKAGWREIASKLQYDRYAIKHWEDEYSLAGKIIREGKNTINNIHEQITLATGRGKNLYNSRVEGIYKELNEGILGLSKALGKGTDVALDMAHRILEATHEPERRLVKYLMAVPLSTTKNIKFGGTMISAADFRKKVFTALDTKSFTEKQAETLRTELDKIVFTTDAKGNRAPNTKYVDRLGDSLLQKTGKDGKVVGVDPDITSPTYNVTGLSLESNANRLANYENEVKNNPELKKHMDVIIKKIKELHDVTTDLNKQANYWSQPVTNRVNFYGWDHYIPLKGVSKANEVDEMLDLDGDAMGREVGDITPSSKGKGKEHQEIAYGLDGRISVSDNPVLQSLSDAVRAAGRAGRKDLTQAIKNSVAKGEFNPNGQGLLAGSVLMNVKFEQRSDSNFLKALPRENTIFHYNEDGSIDVIEINDKKLRESIRRTYKDTHPLVNYANNITSFLGQVHTRYNYNFAPLNFVRDALTNAWTLGAEMGPKKSAEFIAAISGNVINKGAFRKAAKIASLYQKNNTEEIQRLAKADPFVKEMVEFIEEGGMVEYIQGLSLKSNYDRLQKEVGSSMVIRNVKQLNKLIDLWTDMFEITSRASAYSIAKKNFLEENLSETAARTKAAAYAKNLANFEQVGEHGRGLGALFMFFRPSATGAVRAIEAALPAFQNVDKVMKGVPPNLTDAEKATYKKNFVKRQKASRYMLTYLMGLGALSYTMAAMMADEDDLGRNKLMKDDMGQWTRFLRFHTPFSDKPFQIPWGFGLGSFMATGAQMAAVVSGHQSIGSALGNVATQISLDSFVPIPFSRMKIEDNPALFAIDSITPSMLRPALQFVVNKNGLGQDIYNDSNRRMGSAYLGGDNIPQTYKTLATTILDTFGIDVSPNSLYFLANSYADGPMRVVDLLVNSTNLAMDQKEFNAKTDIPFIGSFIGAAPNVDGREFNSITEQVEKMAGRLNMLEKASPEEYAKYLTKNPLHEEIVDFFDKNIGTLNKLRKETNEVRIEPGLSPKLRTQLIRELNQEQNLLKYDLIQQFKAYYDLKP